MRLSTAAEARELDRWAIQDLGIPQEALMECAALNLVMAMEREFAPLAGKRVAVACGKGNNAGDGLVAARHLANQGCQVTLCLAYPAAQLGFGAARPFAACARMGLLVVEGAACGPALAAADLAVDALLGTGGRGAPEPAVAVLIEALNACGKPVVSVDLPSGLDADTGPPQGACVQATLTVTFGSVKRGLALLPGAELCGSLVVADIGIPPLGAALAIPGPRFAADSAWQLTEARDLAPLAPRRETEAHKKSVGSVLIVAGSSAYTGAALLACLAAFKSGAGMVHAAVPPAAAVGIRERLPEAVILPLAADREWLGMDDLAAILQAAALCQAVVVGPGLGREAGTQDLARALWAGLALPAVFDADALFALAESKPPAPGGPRVLTPHSGEMGRLAGLGSAQVEADRPGTALAQARALGAVAVLKGPRSLVATPEGGLFINPSGSPALATAGTGDVLAGLLGGLLAQGLSPLDAARLAVYTHGLAGEGLAAEQGGAGLLASELCLALPRVLARMAAC